MKDERLEVEIRGMALEKRTQMPLLLLFDNISGTSFPLWIGPSEASAILIELEDVHPPRPLTHDLLAEMFIRHKFVLEEVYIYQDLGDHQYLSQIKYHSGIKRYTMEVRPSDGIALAQRLESPIYIKKDILAEMNAFKTEEDFREMQDPDFLFVQNEKKQYPVM